MNKLHVASGFAGLLVCAQGLQAAVSVTTTYTDVAGATPTISDSDLAETQFLSSSSTGTDTMGGARHAEMFNGTIDDAANADTNATDWVRFNDTNTVTLVLDTSINTLGYDITGIDTFAGWNEAGGGRSDHGYSIELGFVGGGTATLINAQNWAPNPAGEFWSVVSITNDGGGTLFTDTVNNNGAGAVADAGTLATGVESITWTITNAANPSIAAEFDVYGFATVPEPSTYALLAGCLALGSVMMRRRHA